MKPMRTGPASFTLVEILVVITIIGLLAGISVPAVGGALNAARRAKAMTMANQIRTAMIQFHTEYGFFPTNGMGFNARGIGATTPALTRVLVGSTNATNDNPRQIVFLEVPADFTRDGAGDPETGGIMTPRDLYKRGSQKNRQFNYSISVDVDYDSRTWVTNNAAETNTGGSCHVWIMDPSDPARKTVGTWR